MGDVWRFGKLNKTDKQITQDINLSQRWLKTPAASYGNANQ